MNNTATRTAGYNILIKLKTTTMATINQINGRIQADATIQFYRQLSEDYNKYRANWRHSYYTFIREGRQCNINVAGNFTFGAMRKSINRITGGTFDRQNINFDVQGHLFYISFDIDENGANITLINSTFDPANKRTNYTVKSNDQLKEFDPVKYYKEQILEKLLYPGGLLRRIQIQLKKSKEEAKTYFINFHKRIREAAHNPAPVEYMQLFRALERRLRRKLNIISDALNERQLLQALKLPRQRTRITAEPMPNPFRIYEEAVSLYDTEEGIMDHATEVMGRRVIYV